MKIWTDNPAGPDSDILPQSNNVNLGSETQPFNSAYITNLVTSGEVLPNNIYLKATNAADTGTLDLLKADATDNTVINGKTGKIVKFAINNATVGSYSATAVNFPIYNLTDGSDKNYTLTSYGSGTGYTLTAVSAAVVMGTTSPSVTLNKAGTYLLIARANLEYVGATFAANRNVTLKLRRTNNTAADVTSSSTVLGTNIVTTVSGVMAATTLPAVLYTTANTDDVVVPFADVSVIPTAGSLQITEANIVAVRLY